MSLNKEAVFHSSNGIWAYQDKPHSLVVILRCKKNDIKEIKIESGDPFMIRPKKNFKKGDEWTRHNVEWITDEKVTMEKYVTDELYDYYKARITTRTKRLQYIFHITSSFDEELVYGSSYFHKPEEWFFRDCFTWGYLDEGNIPKTPKWVQDTIWYQIFPERFRNGNKNNDPKGTLEWNSKLPTYKDLFGGDLEGIIEKLDYIQSLGFNGIYMTPIFKARSSHKYDTSNYSKIDSTFGTEEIFKLLLKECKKRNIRVMLDGVFNHIGAMSDVWQDVIKNKEKSIYKDWFKINDFNDLNIINKDKEIQKDKWKNFVINYPYETFAFSFYMPKFNWSNKEMREFLFKSIRKWTNMGIDGWRLDVAGEPSFAFWREFRQVVRKINPQIYIMGEIMYDAKPFLEGDMFDSVMNYKLRDAIVDFVTGETNKEEFEMSISKNIVRYHRTIQDSMFNLLDSHDKPRLFTLINNDVNKYLLAYSLLFIFSGSPCVYYGCEIGLEGHHDPDNRRCMIWDESKWNKDIQDHFKYLINLRKKHSALRNGEYKMINLQNKDVTLIVRKNEEETLLCFVNLFSKDVELDLSKVEEIKEFELSTTNLLKIKQFSFEIVRVFE